jgi:hypothetical protein
MHIFTVYYSSVFLRKEVVAYIEFWETKKLNLYLTNAENDVEHVLDLFASCLVIYFGSQFLLYIYMHVYECV